MGKYQDLKLRYISSQISSSEDVKDFIKTYNAHNNETLRIKSKKKLTEKSFYLLESYYRMSS